MSVADNNKLRQIMFKQGYRFVGRHSAVKICEWCRASLRNKGFCYKEKFYGILSHRCVQMTPMVFNCTENCLFCWRTMNFKLPDKNFEWDMPEEIIDGCIEEQRKLLRGFLGNRNIEHVKFYEAMYPNQFAISLAGEVCLYPYLPEMVEILKERHITSFIVTNGTVPEMVKRLLKNQPTQLYVTLAACSEAMYKEICSPILEDGWERLMKTLGMVGGFRRSVIRLTLVKDLNMKEPEKYAEIIEMANPSFVECKAFMSIGGARERLGIEQMPTHAEILKFAEKIADNTSYRIVGDKEDSRVVLLAKNADTKIKKY